MKNSIKNILLIICGIVIGAFGTMQISSALAERQAGPLPLNELRQFADVYGLIKSYYVEPVDDKKLIKDAISGMVSSLDPHSSYLDKEALTELEEMTQGRFGGLGIEVGMDDGYVKVISPIEDTPAHHAGVRPGDLITKLDGENVKGMTLQQAVKKMRGDPGTKIRLTINRKNISRPINLTITRDLIQVKSVKSKNIEPGYAWIRIVQFQELTIEDLALHIKRLYKKDPHIKGIVLDLRNDPGGLLQGAIGVASAFLQNDLLVVSTKGQLKTSNTEFFARPEYYVTMSNTNDPLEHLPQSIKSIPIVVLVNAGSASASEIVAGALQDHKRATIMGSQTFGKGSVQTVQQLTNESALKLTTARYYTPNGRSIQAKGIVPDLLVDETQDGNGLNDYRLRESDLDKHLTNDQEDAKKELSEEEEEKLIEAAKNYKPIEYGTDKDFQLQQALNHLKGKHVQLSKKKKSSNAKSNKKSKK